MGWWITRRSNVRPPAEAQARQSARTPSPAAASRQDRLSSHADKKCRVRHTITATNDAFTRCTASRRRPVTTAGVASPVGEGRRPPPQAGHASTTWATRAAHDRRSGAQQPRDGMAMRTIGGGLPTTAVSMDRTALPLSRALTASPGRASTAARADMIRRERRSEVAGARCVEFLPLLECVACGAKLSCRTVAAVCRPSPQANRQGVSRQRPPRGQQCRRRPTSSGAPARSRRRRFSRPSASPGGQAG